MVNKPQNVNFPISTRPLMVSIYVLKLNRGKYYVGMTRKGVKRVVQHIERKGAAWTKKYTPLENDEIEYMKSGLKESDEDRITLEYMDKYGISNVRGGSWCMVRMPRATRSELKRKIASTKSKKNTRKRSNKKVVCKRCGRNSHSVSKCYARTHSNGSRIGAPYKQIDRATYNSILGERKELRRSQLEAEKAKEESKARSKEIEDLKKEIADLESASKETNPDTMSKIIQSVSEDNLAQLAALAAAGVAIAGIVAPGMIGIANRNISKQLKQLSNFVKKTRK
jgi:hypothetical protein